MPAYTAPGIPENEEARVKALADLQILDTAPEDSFDLLTNLAAAIFEVPIALVSMVDSNRQWFKSCYGLNIGETSREVSFCGHAILQNEPLVIKDALKDPRFAENPLVLSDPKVRFYVGAPLDISGDGKNVGTLCIIDTRPREFGEREIRIIKMLATQTLQAIKMRTLYKEAQRNQDSLQILLNTSPLSMVVHDTDKIVFANQSAAKMLGQGPVANLLGKSVLDYTLDDSARQAFASTLQKVSKGENVPAEDVLFRLGSSTALLEIQLRQIQFDHKLMILSTFQDVTDIRAASQALQKNANTDELTGLQRRQVFDKLLRSYSLDDQRQKFSIALFDLDHFKSVNDRFGHSEGDRVLKEVAKLLLNHCRKGDTAVRWGGEEMVIILPDTDLQKAFELAERVRLELEGLNHLPCKVTLSGGVAEYLPTEDITAFFTRVDEALYLAKSSGRNQIRKAAPQKSPSQKS